MRVDGKQIYQNDHTVIYEVTDNQTGKKLVIKVLEEALPDLSHIARFNEEYEITHQLQIKGVRRAVKKHKIDQHHALTLEYIEGYSIEHILQKQDKYSVSDFLVIAAQICEILQQVHQSGIIHKDINPRNIIIDPNNAPHLIDFGIATRIQKRTEQFQNAKNLEGILPYISPEQTGRMDRSLDYRSDLYSLGATFYEMLTGRPPFEGDDAMALVHAHIVKIPASLHKIDATIPEIISEIILKLLAKNAEDRYQSAYGVQADLEKCEQLLQDNPSIPAFELGTKDISDKFQIPEKLYGRDTEAQELLEAFHRVSQGSAELILVAGYSGIGKTALISELHKPLTETRGYFIKAKFDQFSREVPYSAIITALQDFVRQLLSEDEKNITNYWKPLILEAVGENGRVLTEVIPQLEVIIGEQPAIQTLEASGRKERFNTTFLRFAQAISTKNHPLVWFIDDWQWADLGSLDILALLMNSSNQYFMVLGAYRDNEVLPEHPFIQTVEEIQKNEKNVHQIKLLPLEKSDCLHLIQDTLKDFSEQTVLLNEQVYQKTNGNPFFFRQFLKTLYAEGLIAFDFEQKQWTWDIAQIQAQNMTDNVVELMANRVLKLPENTQKALQYGAGIGNEFDLEVLTYVLHEPTVVVLNQVFSAVTERLVLPLGDDYKTVDETNNSSKVVFKFVHDCIQQASYSLLAEEKQQQLALEIGRYLYQKNQANLEEKICDIANYYNIAKTLITDRKERDLAIELNYQAGEKTARSSAFASTLAYFREGISYFDANSWENQYEVSFRLYLKKAEYEYFNNLHEEAQASFQELLKHAKSDLDKARVYRLYTFQLSNMGKVEEAIEKGLIGLKLLGVEVPEGNEAQMAFIQQQVQQVIGFAMPKGVKGVLEMPYYDDERTLLIGDICRGVIVIALYTPLLQGVLGAIMGTLNFKGNNINSSYGYGIIGTMLSRQGVYQYASLMADISLALIDKYENPYMDSVIMMGNAYMVLFWRDAYRDCLKLAERGYKIGLNAGNYEAVAYSTLSFTAMNMVAGVKLNEWLHQSEQKIKVLQERKLMLYLPMALMFRNWGLNMQGKTTSLVSLTNEDFNEEETLANLEKLGKMGEKPFSYYVIVKLHILYLFGKYEECMPFVEKGMTTYQHSSNTSFSVYFPFYSALIYARVYSDATPENQEKYKAYIQTQIEFFESRAKECPDNFQNRHLLLLAEMARIEQDTDKAMTLYDEAIETAIQHDLLHEVALANEIAAHFYEIKNKPQITKLYIQQAHYYYKFWGATAKVEQLEETYPRMLMREKRTATGTQHTVYGSTKLATGSTMLGGTNLDVLSVVKSAQAISGEIKLERLLQKMMRAIVENAGADRGVLMLNERGKLIIEAEYSVKTDSLEVMQSQAITESETLPLDIVNYVFRTQEVVLLHDASRNEQFQKSPYILQYQPNSILCTPVIKQGKLKAVIYLENEGTIGAFSEGRQLIVNMLTSQIAVSIDNAILYENLEERVNQRTEELYQAFEKIKKQHTHIKSSINYARRIQEAILPLSDKIKQSITEHFIFFKPKDVVSGDFYWFAEKRGKIMLSAVDCTGHGVPGAFMSMIGDSLLNQIVHDRNITTAGYILTALNQGIQKSLKQETTQNKDGMDIALCVIDKAEQKLEFAGAKNPLLYVPYEAPDCQIIRGDKWSIGGSYEEKNTFVYDTHEVPLTDKTTTFYIYSDGYQDQFGGKRNMKKFLSRNFRKLLFKIHQEPMESQKQTLDNVITAWQGVHKQVDDMLVIGFRA